MRLQLPLQFLALCLTFGLSATAMAAPCFDELNRPVSRNGCDSGISPHDAWRPADNEVLARDAQGTPLFKAVVVPGAGRNAPALRGIADMSGRVIAPARFDKVYVVTRTLGVGEVELDPRNALASRRAFFIDLKSSEIRPTPFRAINISRVGLGGGTPYLLGTPAEETGMRRIVGVIYPTGADTGLRVQNNGVEIVTTVNGLVQFNRDLYKLDGERPGGGRPLLDLYARGMYVEAGPAPADVGGTAGPLLIPLNSVGDPQDLPPNVIGMINGKTSAWIIRRTPAGLRFYQHQSGVPSLAEAGVGPSYAGLYVGRRADVVKTDRGWMSLAYRTPFPTAEAAAADTDAKIDAFVTAVLTENARAPNPEALRAQQRAAQEAAREVGRANVLARIEQAKREGWGGFRLYDLQRDVIGYQLEGAYQRAGLYVSPDFKREVCWSRPSVICDAPSAPSSSSSGFVSTWEQAFANSRALNQQQGRDNCSAAMMGASRICNQR